MVRTIPEHVPSVLRPGMRFGTALYPFPRREFALVRVATGEEYEPNEWWECDDGITRRVCRGLAAGQFVLIEG